jgi:hypothetical protein
MARRWRAAVLLFGAAVLGCGNAEELPPLHPVTGTVLRNNTPVEGGFLQFSRTDGQADVIVNAHVGKDGKFEATTVKGRQRVPGAPEGTYRVTYQPAKMDRDNLPKTSQKTYKIEARANEFTFDVGGDKPF